MNKARNSILIGRLKSNALKLRGTHQLPSYLVYLILKVNQDTSESEIRSLMSYSEHLLRVKGYYKKYPLIEKQANDELKSVFNK